MAAAKPRSGLYGEKHHAAKGQPQTDTPYTRKPPSGTNARKNTYTRVKRIFGGYGGYESLKPLPDGRFRITTTTDFGGYVVVMVVISF